MGDTKGENMEQSQATLKKSKTKVSMGTMEVVKVSDIRDLFLSGLDTASRDPVYDVTQILRLIESLPTHRVRYMNLEDVDE